MGYAIDAPLPVPAICRLVCELGGLEPAEAYEVFNMGCGFVVVVAPEHVEEAVVLLGARHPGGAARIGQVTDRAGTVMLPGLGLEGDGAGLRATCGPASGDRPQHPLRRSLRPHPPVRGQRHS